MVPNDDDAEGAGLARWAEGLFGMRSVTSPNHEHSTFGGEDTHVQLCLHTLTQVLPVFLHFLLDRACEPARIGRGEGFDEVVRCLVLVRGGGVASNRYGECVFQVDEEVVYC